MAGVRSKGESIGRRSNFVVAHGPARVLPRVDRLLAGVAEADITPPPGMPKAGYSSNANDGDGFRTRLRARVFHLRSGTVSMAIVQCDLLGGSSVVHHLVAEQIRSRTDIDVSSLMIGATHTHAGPGQFLGTDFYNRFASNRFGFDPAWTAFLVERISQAVVTAYETRQPAVAAIGSVDVWGLTRNRSMPPFVNNASVGDKRTDPQRKYVSINPALSLLRIDADLGDHTEPLGAAMVFSVHGTGVSMKSREYNADVWAYIVGELRMRIRETSLADTICSAMEGTHADIAPAIRPKSAGHVESARVGREIGRQAFGLWQSLETDLRSDVVLGATFREVDLERSRSIDGVELPNRPAVGAALVAGATENVTPVVHRIPPFKAGHPKTVRPHRHHGEKWILGSELGQAALLPLRSFPRVIPFQILRIGDTQIAGLPFEITNEAGRRLAESVVSAEQPATDDGSGAQGRVIVSSVVNEYYGYVTTPDEYAVQFYEGGHTLYGPRTLEFLCAHLADAVGISQPDVVVDQSLPARRFDLRVREFWPQPSGVASQRSIVTEPKFTDASATDHGFWSVEWLDVSPGDLEWCSTLVAIEQCDGGEWTPAMRRGYPIDDSSWWVQVTHLGAVDEGRHRYRARWYQPDLIAGIQHRFVLVPNAGQGRVVSQPFD